jgi:hypothetical protein
MTERLRLAASQPIAWPARCARCLTKNELTTCNATSGHVESIRPTLAGSLAVKSDMLSLAYPVCAEHARGLPLANLLTRNTLGARTLRIMVYVLGPLSIVSLATMLATLALSVAKPSARGPGGNLSAGMLVLVVVFAAAFALVVWSFRKLPVRVGSHTGETISLAFSNARYAKEFARLNERLVL